MMTRLSRIEIELYVYRRGIENESEREKESHAICKAFMVSVYGFV